MGKRENDGKREKAELQLFELPAQVSVYPATDGADVYAALDDARKKKEADRQRDERLRAHHAK